MAQARPESIAFWFIFLSYAVGSPAFAIVEFMTGLFSERFDYPPAFLFAVATAQVLAAIGMWSQSLALWAVALLTVLAAGAVYSHFRIDSPLTSLPAWVYVLVQTWYGSRLYKRL